MDWFLGIMLVALFIGIIGSIVPYLCNIFYEIFVWIVDYFKYQF